MSRARTWQRRARRQARALGLGNYVPAVLALAPRVKELGPGTHHVDVYHDDWCASNRGGRCNCDPWVRLRGDPRDN